MVFQGNLAEKGERGEIGVPGWPGRQGDRGYRVGTRQFGIDQTMVHIYTTQGYI